MHPNPVFHNADATQNIAFARARAFGMLAVSAPEGEASPGAPLLAHVPFLLDAAGGMAEMHLLRSNPIVRALKRGPLGAHLAVTGGDSYVSPDWYGIDDQVPTWNYVAVQLTGVLELQPENGLRDLLDRQAAFYEDRLLPKPPWTTQKMTPEVLSRMMRAIVPVKMQIGAVDGTWKLGQNKEAGVREAAAAQVDAYGFGSETRSLAALMQAPQERAERG